MKEIGIIGATSALGLELVARLTAGGDRVFAGYRHEARIPEAWRDDSRIALRKIELAGEDVDFEALLKPSVVWLAHLDQGRFNARETEVNLKPFRRFLAQTANSPVEKFVFVSSGGSVYGEPAALPITEDHPRAPLSSYGRAKRAMEDALFEFSRTSAVKTAIIRPGNIYGFEDPARESKGIIGAYLDAIRAGRTFTLIHGGRTVRDFVHVRDVARAIRAAVESEQKEIVWNVATGRGTTAAAVLQSIIDQSGFAAPAVENVENFASDVGENVLSIDRIAAESGWRPEIPLADGIREVVERWRGVCF
ncbi:MAG: NAD-dependent epimerase/dehydratase family protein [Acidobacteria bacterium]|nr:NAD-dependent epimerase/dehydratase family protein [Acidobacteriota bacterium]